MRRYWGPSLDLIEHRHQEIVAVADDADGNDGVRDNEFSGRVVVEAVFVRPTESSGCLTSVVRRRRETARTTSVSTTERSM